MAAGAAGRSKIIGRAPIPFNSGAWLLALTLLFTAACAPRNSDVIVPAAGAQLGATIYWPSGEGPHPGIVMIHGSGPDTRDNYRLYAEMFARRGFAVLIYDKRGEGTSSGDWRTSPFSVLADDATAALRFLQRQPGVVRDRVGLWGGSEGAVVALQVAAQGPGPAFLILQSATGLPFAQQNLFQTANQMRALGLPPGEVAEALHFQRLKHSYARTGDGWHDYRAALQASRSEPWSSLGGPVDPRDWWWAWYRTKMDVDPAVAASRVRVPLFAVWGERDALVPVQASRRRLAEAVTSAGNRDVTMLTVPEADHSINTQAGPNPSPIYTDAMFDWARRFVRRP